MAHVSFNKSRVSTRNFLYFNDLDVNESFVINTVRSEGAVYRKVEKNTRSWEAKEYYMMEEATGKLFPGTVSPVKRVEVAVDIKAAKPSCY